MAELFVSGIDDVSRTVEKVLLKATNNLSWLNKGDTVLLKPSMNSFYPYPSTTHPGTVQTIADILEKRGAKVVVGDLSGTRHVLQDEHGVHKSTTRDVVRKAGLTKDSTFRFVGFEEGGWGGFYKFDKGTGSWKDGFYITDWVKKADHIINLPRLSTHSQAGVTLGFKCFVGMLRDDSRFEFHKGAPYNALTKLIAKGKKQHSKGKGDNKFIEKITEISLALKEKLRLTLITATEAQATFGPDIYVLSVKMGKLSRAFAVKPKTGLVFASDDQVAAEAFALAFLTHLYQKKVPLTRKLLQKYLVMINGQIRELGKVSIWENRFLKHALKLNLGSRDFKINYEDVPEELRRGLNALISGQSGQHPK